MALAATGYFRRLTRRLTEDIDQLDAEEMIVESTQASGAQRACDCSRGEEVTMYGRLRSVETSARASAAGMEAEFFDGTDAVTLVWLGRRRIAGIETGKKILVRGRLGARNGLKVIYNPYYELQGD
ncbi:OB-fold nucleic acid binding domain-containing protein [Rhodococcus kronopolitis]|uniref:OB-fold nucleic acid binding domain-containing protein n=1 Tax=Rhodococcus kronopolitis TaxID=1460226 RepID=A0ABV9FL93_9NOCA